MDVPQWLVLSQQWDHILLQARSFLEYGDMLVVALSLLAAFILMSVITDTNIDDDDGPGGGMMIPASVPTS